MDHPAYLGGMLGRPLGICARLLAWILIVSIVVLTRTIAAPPDNPDPSLGLWFNSLAAPDGTPCCSIADCRPTTARHTADGYEARIGDAWVTVPWDRVLARPDNPTGKAIVCYAPRTTIVLCFVRPPDS
jgi:hypothetical protein